MVVDGRKWSEVETTKQWCIIVLFLPGGESCPG